MKKTNILTTTAVLSAMALTVSCSKSKDTNTDQTASLTKATITGRITAKTVDTAGAAAMQYAPAGTIIQAWVDTKDYVLGNTDTNTVYAKKYFTATSDANGYFTLDISVSSYNPAQVHIVPSDFEFNVLKKNNLTTPAALYTDRKVFHANGSAHMLHAGQKLINDINFN